MELTILPLFAWGACLGLLLWPERAVCVGIVPPTLNLQLRGSVGNQHQGKTLHRLHNQRLHHIVNGRREVGGRISKAPTSIASSPALWDKIAPYGTDRGVVNVTGPTTQSQPISVIRHDTDDVEPTEISATKSLPDSYRTRLKAAIRSRPSDRPINTDVSSRKPPDDVTAQDAQTISDEILTDGDNSTSGGSVGLPSGEKSHEYSHDGRVRHDLRKKRGRFRAKRSGGSKPHNYRWTIIVGSSGLAILCLILCACACSRCNLVEKIPDVATIIMDNRPTVYFVGREADIEHDNMGFSMREGPTGGAHRSRTNAGYRPLEEEDDCASLKNNHTDERS